MRLSSLISPHTQALRRAEWSMAILPLIHPTDMDAQASKPVSDLAVVMLDADRLAMPDLRDQIQQVRICLAYAHTVDLRAS